MKKKPTTKKVKTATYGEIVAKRYKKQYYDGRRKAWKATEVLALVDRLMKGEKLTVEDVKARVEEIRRIAVDDEVAHSTEDDLHQNVLSAIAEGSCDDPAACAKEALKTRDIKFARWCA